MSLVAESAPYMTTHLDFEFNIFSFLAGAGSPGCLLCVCLNKRTRFMKRRSMFCAVLADVSMNSHPSWCARAAPSSLETSRSTALSHLFPMSMKVGSPHLTLRIDWWKCRRRSNVDLEVTEYTRIKPCPSLQNVVRMSKSRICKLMTLVLTGPIDHARLHIPKGVPEI